MAKEISATAVADRLGTICVAQFNRDTAKSQKLIDMKGKDNWDKSRYIDTQSWAIMPGEDKAETGFRKPAPSSCRPRVSRRKNS